jgi:hypothetical protein
MYLSASRLRSFSSPSRRRFLLGSLLAAAVSGIAVACGGGDGDGEATQTESALMNEDELAESMLLSVDDFPSGWSEAPVGEEEESPFDKCDQGDSEGRTGRAETGDFSRGDQATVSQGVAIFQTAQQVEAPLDRFSELGECLAGVVEDGELDNDEAAFSDATFGPLAIREFGDRTDAYRIKIHFKAKQQTGLGSEGDLFVDAVLVTNGRVGFTIRADDALTPFDTDELEDIVGKAQSKVEQVLSKSESFRPDARRRSAAKETAPVAIPSQDGPAAVRAVAR